MTLTDIINYSTTNDSPANSEVHTPRRAPISEAPWMIGGDWKVARRGFALV